jgi:hypothetical protein
MSFSHSSLLRITSKNDGDPGKVQGSLKMGQMTRGQVR